MRILLATSNPHKLEEIRAILDEQRRGDSSGKTSGEISGRTSGGGGGGEGGLGIELIDLHHALPAPIPEPVEDQPTFEGNALLKARYYAAATGMVCLADDSGLEVDALAGQPGVRSARYAGVTGPRSVVDPANNRLLLKKLGDTPAARTARFVCTMALCGPRELCHNLGFRIAVEDEPFPTLALVRGTVEGRILLPRETADMAQPHLGRGAHGFGYDPLFLITELGKTTAQLDPPHKNTVSHRGRATRLLWGELRRLGLRG